MTDNEVLVADDECTVTSGRVIGQRSTDTECLNGKGIDNSPRFRRTVQPADSKKSQGMQCLCGGSSVHHVSGRDKEDESKGNHIYRRT